MHPGAACEIVDHHLDQDTAEDRARNIEVAATAVAAGHVTEVVCVTAEIHLHHRDVVHHQQVQGTEELMQVE